MSRNSSFILLKIVFGSPRSTGGSAPDYKYYEQPAIGKDYTNIPELEICYEPSVRMKSSFLKNQCAHITDSYVDLSSRPSDVPCIHSPLELSDLFSVIV